MKSSFVVLWFGVREPFRKRNYTILLIGIFGTMLALLVLIPVWAVPGNMLATQLGIFTLRDYVVIVLLSFLSSLFMTMQVYVMRERKKIKEIAGAGTAVGAGLSALFAGIAGTAFCASCLAPLFAAFGIGFGGAIFVLDYRWYFVAVITLLLLIAIYLTARRVNRICALCYVSEK